MSEGLEALNKLVKGVTLYRLDSSKKGNPHHGAPVKQEKATKNMALK
jgi:hypothetical protein